MDATGKRASNRKRKAVRHVRTDVLELHGEPWHGACLGSRIPAGFQFSTDEQLRALERTDLRLYRVVGVPVHLQSHRRYLDGEVLQAVAVRIR